MASGRKAQTWHFGMKLHVAAVGAGIIRACVAGPANEHDITRLGDVLTGKETKGVFVDPGYAGLLQARGCRSVQSRPAEVVHRGQAEHGAQHAKLVENQEGTLARRLRAYLDLYRSIEFSRASVRCCVEWSFLLAQSVSPAT